jgi:hypothetical protein
MCCSNGQAYQTAPIDKKSATNREFKVHQCNLEAHNHYSYSLFIFDLVRPSVPSLAMCCSNGQAYQTAPIDKKSATNREVKVHQCNLEAHNHYSYGLFIFDLVRPSVPSLAMCCSNGQAYQTAPINKKSATNSEVKVHQCNLEVHNHYSYGLFIFDLVRPSVPDSCSNYNAVALWGPFGVATASTK